MTSSSWVPGLLPANAFDIYPIVALDAPPGKAELSAIDDERLIRRRYRWPNNWFWHRLADRFGAASLFGVSDGGRRVLEAVDRSNTKLRNYKIRLLSHAIRTLRPRTILELGAGASTFLIAELLRENSIRYGISSKLFSVEGSSEYFQRVKDAIPNELKPFVHLQESGVSLRWFGDYRALTYDALPNFEYCDLVFIDGPAPLIPEYRQPIFALSGDLVVLTNAGMRFSLALTDVRWMNATFYRSQLSQEYNVAVDIPWRTVRISRARK
jgi:predicted O-methyltransferase YrrM